MGALNSIDLAILRFFNIIIANPIFDFFFVTLSDFHFWRWIIAAAIIMLLWKGGTKGRWMVALTILTVALTDSSIHLIIKPLVGRLRPSHEEALTWLRLIDGRGGKYGFPSNHVANSFGAAIIVSSFYRRTRVYLYSIATLVSISRIYLGVHYPSDVLGGAIYGICLGIFIQWLKRLLVLNMAFQNSMEDKYKNKQSGN